MLGKQSLDSRRHSWNVNALVMEGSGGVERYRSYSSAVCNLAYTEFSEECIVWLTYYSSLSLGMPGSKWGYLWRCCIRLAFTCIRSKCRYRHVLCQSECLYMQLCILQLIISPFKIVHSHLEVFPLECWM